MEYSGQLTLCRPWNFPELRLINNAVRADAMTSQNHQDLNSSEAVPAGANSDPAVRQDGRQAARRRLLKGGLAAAPVVLSVASRPVHAAGVCVNPSGFISVPTFKSRHPNATVCSSNGPTYWKNLSLASWPQMPGSNPAASLAGVTFVSVFGSAATGMDPSSTVRAVLVSGNSTPFAQYCIAAYANSVKGVAGWPVTANEARSIWSTVRATAKPPGAVTYPAASLQWNEAKTLIWLQTLMSA